jgi:hypothetical protein
MAELHVVLPRVFSKSSILVIVAVLIALAGCGGVPSGSSSTSTDPSTAAPTIALSAQPTSVTAGTTVTLSWTASNATAVTIDNGIGTVALTGSMNVAPSATTTYTATASSASASAKSSATITVTSVTAGTPTIQLMATPASIASGGSSTLTWTSTNATSVTINNGIGTVALNSSASAPITVKPSTTTTYTATASNGGTPAVGSATVTVTNSPPPSSVSVPTWHGDNARSGLNANETVLTPTNVASGKFGRLFSYLVDGYIYAQPLYVPNLTINGAQHNVVFVATEYDSIYAFDADDSTVGQLWKTSLLASGETPLAGGNPLPWIGVTATPAIDLPSNTMYVVSEQKTASGNNFRLHALNIVTGQEKSGSPVVIQGSVPSTLPSSGGKLTLTTSCLSRASLLVTSTSVVFGMGACGPGWVLSYDKSTLKQTGLLNTSPNIAGYGQYPGAGGVWMGGAGPAADSAENIYLTTGDGPYDGSSSWGVSALKLKNTDLSILDSFTPADQPYLWCRDSDLASGGVSVVPGASQVMVGGKAGIVYLLNTGNMGKQQANDAGAAQWFFWGGGQYTGPACTDGNGNPVTPGTIAPYQLFSTGAWFNGSVYIGADPGPIRQFIYAGGKLTPGTVSAQTSSEYQAGIMGTTPFVSSSGGSNGIVWTIDHGAPLQDSKNPTPSSAVLHAYDATNLASELYNSSTNGADMAGYGIKFTSPIVANGKVFIGTGHDPTSNPNPQGELDVYGLQQ